MEQLPKVIVYQGKHYVECPKCGLRTNFKLSLYRTAHYCNYCKKILVVVPGENEIITESEWRIEEHESNY